MMANNRRSRSRVTITLDPGLLDWIQEAKGETSRSRFIEACMRATQEVIGTQARALDSDETRAVHAIKTLRAGEIPSAPDLESLARSFGRRREVAD